MSNSSHEQPATSSTRRIDPLADAVRVARGRVLGAAAGCDSFAVLETYLDDYAAAVRSAATAQKDFYTVADLEARYTLTRKTVERLPIPRHKMGGVVRFALADVIAFEESSREALDQAS